MKENLFSDILLGKIKVKYNKQIMILATGRLNDVVLLFFSQRRITT